MIVERTQEGKAIAKQRDDFHEGRPKKYGKKHIEEPLKMLGTNSYKEVTERTGISLIRAKKERGNGQKNRKRDSRGLTN